LLVFVALSASLGRGHRAALGTQLRASFVDVSMEQAPQLELQCSIHPVMPGVPQAKPRSNHTLGHRPRSSTRNQRPAPLVLIRAYLASMIGDRGAWTTLQILVSLWGFPVLVRGVRAETPKTF
jgi:hypothetical protein